LLLGVHGTRITASGHMNPLIQETR
jgi:hypothetical protein